MDCFVIFQFGIFQGHQELVFFAAADLFRSENNIMQISSDSARKRLFENIKQHFIFFQGNQSDCLGKFIANFFIAADVTATNLCDIIFIMLDSLFNLCDFLFCHCNTPLI